MSETNHSEHSNRLRLALAAGLSAAALSGALIGMENGSASPISEAHTPAATMPPVESSTPTVKFNINSDETASGNGQALESFDPESLKVSSKAEEIMKANVAYIPALGCSGFIVRDKAGHAIGLETAEHCNLLPDSKLYSTNKSNGHKQILINGEPMLAYTGSTAKDLNAVGEISQIRISSEPNMTAHNGGLDSDVVIASFAGNKLDDVVSAYNAMALSETEISRLKQGEVIYNSGWPVNQPNSAAAIERQSFAMTYLGQATWKVVNGEILKLALAAVPESRDGAECSWGNSGSAAFIVDKDGNPKLIGTASAFNDFGLLYNKKDGFGNTEKQIIESEFHVSMNGYAAVCGFAYEQPADSAAQIVDVINQADLVNSPIAQKVKDRFITDFNSGTEPKKIINGMVQIGVPGQDPFYVDNPAYDYDSDTQSLVIGWLGMDANGKAALKTESFTGYSAMGYLKVLPNKDQSKPELSSVSVNNNRNGYVTDNGQPLGLVLNNMNSIMFDQAYAIEGANGLLFLNPPMK